MGARAGSRHRLSPGRSPRRKNDLPVGVTIGVVAHKVRVDDIREVCWKRGDTTMRTNGCASHVRVILLAHGSARICGSGHGGRGENWVGSWVRQASSVGTRDEAIGPSNRSRYRPGNWAIPANRVFCVDRDVSAGCALLRRLGELEQNRPIRRAMPSPQIGHTDPLRALSARRTSTSEVTG